MENAETIIIIEWLKNYYCNFSKLATNMMMLMKMYYSIIVKRRFFMAIAIAPTPILREKDAHDDFIKKVESGLKKTAKLISTPKIENARKIVMNYVSRIKK